MTNLPISNNNFQSSSNSMPSGAPLPVARPSEGRASGNADPTSKANSVANDQVTDNFFVLLARQIGETSLLPLDFTQIPAAVHGKSTISDADPTLKDTQDKASIATSITIDPANSVTAILMQIPAQKTDATSTPAVDATMLRADPSRPVPSKEVGGIKQAIKDNLERTADKSIGADKSLPTTNNRQQADSPVFIPLSSDAAKHEELKFIILGQPHTGQNITQDAHSVSASAVMPNILNNDIRADTPQTISTPIDNSGWADEFSQKIVWMSTQQNQIAELNLNPPDLGPLNVVLKFSDNQLTAQFTSPHSAVRDAVENAMPKLREMLADNNITLGNATVSDQAPRDRGAEGFMKQDSGTAAQRKASLNEIESNGVSPTSSQSLPVRRHNGMLDIFA